MRKPWVQTIRRETGLIEHVCKCGVGHPSAGSVHWMKLNGIKSMGVHGCCGCCRDQKWQMEDLWSGLRIANKLLFDELKRKKKGKKHE